jgi:hypothetical protein
MQNYLLQKALMADNKDVSALVKKKQPPKGAGQTVPNFSAGPKPQTTGQIRNEIDAQGHNIQRQVHEAPLVDDPRTNGMARTINSRQTDISLPSQYISECPRKSNKFEEMISQINDLMGPGPLEHKNSMPGFTGQIPRQPKQPNYPNMFQPVPFSGAPEQQQSSEPHLKSSLFPITPAKSNLNPRPLDFGN